MAVRTIGGFQVLDSAVREAVDEAYEAYKIQGDVCILI